ncbi:GNAT family N-acetyltransferase [Aeromicrobium sp. CF3.5]|uniref:GNAT family N-acetyltransferase n=1 Tax=Aeromicrobium sp. CF3.5 TaxID=3373078 RepID=UPI003EE6F36E
MPIRPAAHADLEPLAELAARTFPLAAPDDAAPEAIAAFIAEHLSIDRLAGYLIDPDRDVLVDDVDGILLGYAMLIAEEPDDADVIAVVSARPAIYLSKFYVSPDAHGTGAATRLMTAVLDASMGRGAAVVWLGVNEENARAHRFYERENFVRVGTKRFQIGARLEHDFVYQRAVGID